MIQSNVTYEQLKSYITCSRRLLDESLTELKSSKKPLRRDIFVALMQRTNRHRQILNQKSEKISSRQISELTEMVCELHSILATNMPPSNLEKFGSFVSAVTFPIARIVDRIIRAAPWIINKVLGNNLRLLNLTNGREILINK